MANEPHPDPALAFALYASIAATMAISALRDAGLVDKATIDLLVTSLTTSRRLAGDEPGMVEHAELLTDLLLNENSTTTTQVPQ